MKPKKILLSGLVCALLFNGCAPSQSSEPQETQSATQESSTELQTYRQVILQLQQELETLRTSQLQQSDAYEKKIDELEALIAELEVSKGESDEKTNDTSAKSLYSYTLTENGAIITSYLGEDSLAEIPATLDGVPVVGIGEGAFRNSSAEQVVIPSGVISVDWFAFYGSYRLRSVILPASVQSIEYGAFELCSSALKFTCPSGSYAAQYAASYGIPVIPLNP